MTAPRLSPSHPCGADAERRKTYACTPMNDRLPWLGAWVPKAD